MKFQKIQISQLKPHEMNPRITIESEYRRLVEELRRDKDRDIIKSAIWVRDEGDGYRIIDGHHRVKAMQEVGITECPAMIAEDYSEEEALADLVGMNKEVAEFDDVKVAKIIKLLRDNGYEWKDLEARLGYKEQKLQEYVGLLEFDFNKFQFTTTTTPPDFNEPRLTYSIAVTKAQLEVIEHALTECQNKLGLETREQALMSIIRGFTPTG